MPIMPISEHFSCTSTAGEPLVTLKDTRSVSRILIDKIHCLMRTISICAHFVKEFFDRWTHITIRAKETKAKEWHFDLDNLPWTYSKESEGLFLFVHGLWASPLFWRGYVKQVESENPRVHIVAPHVPKKGNCSLEEAAAPILDVVRDYSKRFPEKPISLFGHSNGGRVISYIESHLKPEEMNGRRLSYISVAGVHYGTDLIQGLRRWRLLSVSPLDSTLARELHWGSDVACDLLMKMRQKQQEWKERNISVRHCFCATLDDEMVFHQSSELPYLNESSEYKIFHGETHSTLISAAQHDVMSWLKKTD